MSTVCHNSNHLHQNVAYSLDLRRGIRPRTTRFAFLQPCTVLLPRTDLRRVSLTPPARRPGPQASTVPSRPTRRLCCEPTRRGSTARPWSVRTASASSVRRRLSTNTWPALTRACQTGLHRWVDRHRTHLSSGHFLTRSLEKLAQSGPVTPYGRWLV